MGKGQLFQQWQIFKTSKPNIKMNNELQPYQILTSKFLGEENGSYTYEITFNQSLIHTGRWKGIEDGLNVYRDNEIKEEEERILAEAEKIREKRNQ